MGIDFYSKGVPCQKSSSGPNIIGLHPEFRYRLWRALIDPRLEGSAVYSGTREDEHQARLRVSNGCPDVYKSPASTCRIPTAIPGRSLHNRRPVGFKWGNLNFESRWAIAADIWFAGRPSSEVDPVMSSYGLHRIRSEPWHWQINQTGELMVIVGEGSTSEAAQLLQTNLNRWVGTDLTVDGLYGPLTARAVEAFQKSHGLPIRGDWTKDEQSKLEQIQLTPTAGVRIDRDTDRAEREALRQIRNLATQALNSPND